MLVTFIQTTESCLEHTFNGSIIAQEDGKYTYVISSWDKADVYMFYRNQMTNALPCKIACKKINKDGEVSDYKVVTEFGTEEDPRVFALKNKLHMSYTKVFLDEQTMKMKMLQIVDTTKQLYRAIDMNDLGAFTTPVIIPYKGNILGERKLEKNWLFFEHNEKMHVIYSVQPLLIIDEDMTEIKFDTTLNLPYHVRGGACPVLLGDYYYLFAHTREDVMFTSKYRMIVVLLHKKDLSIAGYSDPINLNISARIVFPMGALFVESEQNWYITCGMEDKHQVMVRMSRDEVYNKVKLVNHDKNQVA